MAGTPTVVRWLAIGLRYRRLAGAVAATLVVTLVLLLSARWTSYAYFALGAPVALLLPVLAAWQTRLRGGPAASGVSG